MNMVDVLLDIKEGKLKGTKKIKISNQLKEFPEILFEVADTLEILDLSNNLLTSLPDEMVKFKKLKIIFLSFNQFKTYPSVLGKLPLLEMIGFKTNQIDVIPEDSFPPLLRWLILTDNQIGNIPASLGNCMRLQKLMLGGNKLNKLPESFSLCTNLQLIRLAQNDFQKIPDVLFELPSLAWVALSGNPIINNINSESPQVFYWQDFEVLEELGAGASGNVYKAISRNNQDLVALKVYKGGVTSDGDPKDEITNTFIAGDHENLIPVLGVVQKHPESKDVLSLQLLDNGFKNLGMPPTFVSCTRDVYEENTQYNTSQVLLIAMQLASVLAHLHEKGLMHGDLYAHNILINKACQVYLSDFGASFQVPKQHRLFFERMEVKAYGFLLEDLIQFCPQKNTLLEELMRQCLSDVIEQRPLFKEIFLKLNKALT